MPKGSLDIHAWARMGAAQRLRDIEEERAAIVAAFPELGGGPVRRRPGRPPKNAALAAVGASVAAHPRRRRPMSAAARKAISDAQKARWAKRKRTAKKAAE